MLRNRETGVAVTVLSTVKKRVIVFLSVPISRSLAHHRCMVLLVAQAGGHCTMVAFKQVVG